MSELDDYFEQVEKDFMPKEEKARPAAPKKPRSANGVWKAMRAMPYDAAAMLSPLQPTQKSGQAHLSALNQLLKKHGAEKMLQMGELYLRLWYLLRKLYNLTGPPSPFQFVKLGSELLVMLETEVTTTEVEEKKPSPPENDLSGW